MPKRKPTNDGGRAAKTRAIATPPAAGATAADGQTARRLHFSQERSREVRASSPGFGDSEEEIEESEASSTDSGSESAGAGASRAGGERRISSDALGIDSAQRKRQKQYAAKKAKMVARRCDWWFLEEPRPERCVSLAKRRRESSGSSSGRWERGRAP